MEFMYLESQIVSINMNVYCHRIHIRICTPVPFHEFDAFYLLFAGTFHRIIESRAMWLGSSQEKRQLFNISYLDKFLERQMNDQLFICITLHPQP